MLKSKSEITLFIFILNIIIIIYWILTKYINIREHVFLNAMYEMSAIIFVGLTAAIPIIILALMIMTFKDIKKRNIIYYIFNVIFSIINIFVMVADPKNF